MEYSKSQHMELYNIKMHKDDCWGVINELGKRKWMHFIDLNKNEQVFNLEYGGTIKRCQDILISIK